MATTKVVKAWGAHKGTVRSLFANAAPWARQVDVANLLEHLVFHVGHFRAQRRTLFTSLGTSLPCMQVLRRSA